MQVAFRTGLTVFLKIFSGKANSVDPDQRSSLIWSALFAYAILLLTLVYKILEHLPYLETGMRHIINKQKTCIHFILHITCTSSWQSEPGSPLVKSGTLTFIFLNSW